MTIQPSPSAGQFAAEVYHELLTLVRRDLKPHAPLPSRQRWRFQAPEPNPALQAYWRDLFKHEWAALDQDWGASRFPVHITDQPLSEEATDVHRQQAS